MIFRGRRTRDVEQALRAAHTSLGSYPLYWAMRNGDCLCVDCARAHRIDIMRAHRWGLVHDDWRPYGVDVNWEARIWCDNCSKQIDSAYPVPETP